MRNIIENEVVVERPCWRVAYFAAVPMHYNNVDGVDHDSSKIAKTRSFSNMRFE